MVFDKHWGTNSGQAVEPPAAKKDQGFNPQEPFAAEHLNWMIQKLNVDMRAAEVDIIVGSAAQVTAGDATHTVNDFAAAAADLDRILFLGNQVHTLTGSAALTEADLEFIFLPGAVLDGVSTYTFTLSGARCKGRIRVTGFSTGGIILSGADTVLEVEGAVSSTFALSGGAVAYVSNQVEHHGSLDVTGSVTLTAGSPEIILSTPSGAYTQALPTTAVKKGKKFTVKNLSAIAGRNITINSSGGNLVWLVCPGNECTLIALQDAPTSATHWALLNRGWPIWARVHKSVDQTGITEDTPVLVTFDTVLSDPASIFVDANDNMVLPLSGWWEIEGSAAFELASGSFAYMAAVVYLNGVQVAGGDLWQFNDPTTYTRETGKVKGLVNCTVPGTDAVTLVVIYGGASGADVGLLAEAGIEFTTNKGTWLSAKYIGPALGGP